MNSLRITRIVLMRMLQEKTAFIFLALLPVAAGIVVTVIAPLSEPQAIPIGINTLDHPLAQALESLGTYALHPMTETEIKESVESQAVSAGLLLPDNLTPVQLLAKSSDTQVQTLSATVNAIMEAMHSGQAPPDPQAGDMEWERPRMALGFLTLFMLMFMG